MAIAAKFPGTCRSCKSHFDRGTAIVQILRSGKRVGWAHQTCAEPWVRNPWFHQHIERDAAFVGEGYTYKLSRQITAGEYNSEEFWSPIKCGLCGEDAWKKATVGAYICPCCGAGRFGFPGEWKIIGRNEI